MFFDILTLKIYWRWASKTRHCTTKPCLLNIHTRHNHFPFRHLYLLPENAAIKTAGLRRFTVKHGLLTTFFITDNCVDLGHNRAVLAHNRVNSGVCR